MNLQEVYQLFLHVSGACSSKKWGLAAKRHLFAISCLRLEELLLIGFALIGACVGRWEGCSPSSSGLYRKVHMKPFGMNTGGWSYMEGVLCATLGR